jgi:hypothetical protein
MKTTSSALATCLIFGSALTSLIGCSNSVTTNAQTPEPANSPPTVFNCVQQDGQWVTVPEKGNVIAKSPLFIWKTLEFGDKYTPKERCKIVSDKLTKAVQKNGGFLSELSLKYGQVNGKMVICVSKQENCNGENQLFTLRQADAETPQKVWNQIMDFAQNKTSSGLEQFGEQSTILLKDLVKFEKL